ncbi:Lipoate-protein ligase B [gamma proteobacterium HdN1]|nr:Lipoate-protein ligase B [gamma proteobacterium HdN1]
MSASSTLIIRHLGLRDYEEIWHAMQTFTDTRGEHATDELWCVQHPPVFTQGQAGKAEHLLATGDIPVIAVDRGGQVTYHGPGQIVIYPLLDLRRMQIGVRELVTRIEHAIVDTLQEIGVSAYPREDAPGVYVQHTQTQREYKIASLGLRIRKGCSFHGLALNVDMDLEPFHRINPCGFIGLEMAQVRDFQPTADLSALESTLCKHLCHRFGYRHTLDEASLTNDASLSSEASLT